MVIGLLAAIPFLAFPETAPCAVVEEKEALAVADLWYAMEINFERTELSPAMKAERLARIGDREVLYLLSKDELVAKAPEGGEVLAYVVKYEPSGFVVVSGEDRLEPVLAYNADGVFSFEDPERNFMRHFLATALIGRWEGLRKLIAAGEKPPVHENWTYLRNRMEACPSLKHATFGPRTQERYTYVLWDTPLWNQPWPYNETAAAHNGGHDVPTGCTATAMAIMFKYHEWPPTGNGTHSYDDDKGSIQYHHFVDFGSTTYDWPAMPFNHITKSNQHVADLMYHCGVAVDMDYELGGSGAWPSVVATNTHFRYKGTTEYLSSHENAARNSIIGGLPVMMSTAPHTVVACGYRSSPAPNFYINAGYSGGSNGWYNLSGVPGGGSNPVEKSYPYSSPDNYMYVDKDSGYPENGTLKYPFNSLDPANSSIPSGGHLWIAGGTYTGSGNVPITFTKAMEIKAYDGVVTIE